MPPGMAPGENIYENVPVKREGDRPKAPLPPIPPPKGVAGVANGGLLPPIPPKNAATAAAGVAATNLLDQRMRGVSVDRYQEYKTPGYYEDTYYTRATTDGRVTVKHVDAPRTGAAGVNTAAAPGVAPMAPALAPGLPGIGGKLERHASHPNLRPRPATAGGRRLPQTPRNPPGTIIVIENVVGKGKGRGTGRTLPEPKRAGSSAARPGAGRGTGVPNTNGVNNVNNIPNGDDRRSYSLPRRPPTAKSSGANPQGTGRRLPPTPQQSALPLAHAPASVTGGRKRELPKPQSLELRHSNREIMNNSNASMGLNGGLLGRSSRSMNFPRLEGSPTHR